MMFERFYFRTVPGGHGEDCDDEMALHEFHDQEELSGEKNTNTDIAAPAAGVRKPGLFTRLLPVEVRSLRNGWRGVIAGASCATILIIVINVILLAWGNTRPYHDNNRLLYEGSCKTAKTIDVLAHLVINLMSTLVLSASNYSMQIISAPTRETINMAHIVGKHLDVGVSSFRNIFAVSKKQKMLWLFLMVGSLPLHLFWNSTIVFSDQGINYSFTAVTRDFLEYPGSARDTYYTMENTTYSTMNISTSDCLSMIQSNVVSDIVKFFFVTDMTWAANGNDSFIAENIPLPAYAGEVLSEDELGVCNPFYGDEILEDNSCLRPGGVIYVLGPEGYNNKTINVEYCLIKKVQIVCSLELVPVLLYIVLVFNTLKVVGFLTTAVSDFEPILTLGDAVAEFLEHGTVTPLAKGIEADRMRRPKRSVRLYFGSVSISRLIFTLTGMLSYWAFGMFLFSSSLRNPAAVTLARAWSNGITSIDPGSIWTHSPILPRLDYNSVLVRALVANSFQLVLSIIYLYYNALWTYMMLAKELVSYAWSWKGLRTFKPSGAQRSTYFLTLPYRYSVPMIVSYGFLHWFLGLSIFVVQIQLYDTWGQSYGYLNGIGWSKLALLLTLVLAGSMIVATMVMGFRPYPKTIPMVSSNSLAISSLCRSLKGESVKKLKFGTVFDGNECRDTFSSGPVVALLERKEHWWKPWWRRVRYRKGEQEDEREQIHKSIADN